MLQSQRHGAGWAGGHLLSTDVPSPVPGTLPTLCIAASSFPTPSPTALLGASTILNLDGKLRPSKAKNCSQNQRQRQDAHRTVGLLNLCSFHYAQWWQPLQIRGKAGCQCPVTTQASPVLPTWPLGEGLEQGHPSSLVQELELPGGLLTQLQLLAPLCDVSSPGRALRWDTTVLSPAF